MSYLGKRPPLKISSKKRKRPKIATSKVTKRTITSTSTATGGSCGVPSILSGDIPIGREILSQSKTRTNQSNEEEPDALLFDYEVPSDIILAIRSLKQRHSHATCDLYHSYNAAQFVLKPMLNATLFTSSNDSKTNQVASAMASTGFDQELEKLCRSGDIRMLQLQGMNGEDDEAIFEMEDYLRGVQDVRIHSDRSQHDQKVIDLFTSVVKQFHLTHVSGKDLVNAMEEHNNKRNDDEYLLNADEWIDHLINYQLLLPRRLSTSHASNCRESYWLVLPKIGQSASFITEGRRRMVLRLKRAPNNEIKRSSLEQYAKGGMAGPFHVRDLLARGLAKRKLTANGEFVKLVANA
jgi:hypothetical protein